jgi:hypothetical protein
MRLSPDEQRAMAECELGRAVSQAVTEEVFTRWQSICARAFFKVVARRLTVHEKADLVEHLGIDVERVKVYVRPSPFARLFWD